MTIPTGQRAVVSDAFGLSLPDGWRSELYGGNNDLVVLTRPGPHGGMVTIDLKRRIFATGMGSPRSCAVACVVYDGRDWRRRLVADAITHLDDVMR